MTAFRALATSLATLCTLSFASSGAAQQMTPERIEFLMTRDNSRFSAPVTILPDHPQCNAPGEVAFAAKLDAQDMDIRISSPNWRGSIKQFNFHGEAEAGQTCLATKNMNETPDQARCAANPADESVSFRSRPACFTTLRRGTEVTRFEVACPEETPTPSLNQRILDADIRIDVVASAQLCQSVTGIALLQSQWTATLAMGDTRQTLEREIASAAQPRAFGTAPLDIRLNLSRAAFGLQPGSPDLASGPFQLDPMRSATFQIVVTVDDLEIPGIVEMPARLHSRRGFRLNVQ